MTSRSSDPTSRRPQRRRKTVHHYTDDNPDTFTRKEREARAKSIPTPRSPSPPNAAVTTVVVEQDSGVEPPRDTILAHAVAMQPILPLDQPPPSPTLPQRYPVAFGQPWRLLPPPRPEWTAAGESSQSSFTSVARHREHTVVGQANGRITVLWRQQICAQIETAASQRPSTTTHKKNLANAVIAVDLQREYTVMATNDEIQVIHVPTGNIEWNIPLARRNDAKQGNPLLAWNHDASIFLYYCPRHVPTQQQQQQQQQYTNAIYLAYRQSQSIQPLEIQGCEQTALYQALALDQQNRILTVVQPKDTDEPILLRSNTHGRISHQVTLPSKIHCTRIVQTDEAILLCTTRGIRCHDAQTLQYVTSYGENVQLHGKTIVWNDCLVLPYDASIPSDEWCWHKKQTWRGRPDAATEPPPTPTTHALLGVPHPTRGPSELQSTLYVWKPGHVVPVATIPAPTGGLLGVQGRWTPRGWELLAVTPHHIGSLRATLQSNFAGTMYPVGYQVIRENVEYIEDEGEMDHVIRIQRETTTGAEPDAQLVKAVQKSLEEDEEDVVSVIASEEEEEEDGMVIPCRVDIGGLLLEDNQDPSSPPRKRHASIDRMTLDEWMSMFPQSKMVETELQIRLTQKEDPDVDKAAALVAKPKPKRTRVANVEALLQASVDPILRSRMLRLQKQWGDGHGTVANDQNMASRLSVVATASQEDKELALDLLMLSPSHTPAPSSDENGQDPNRTIAPTKAQNGGGSTDSSSPKENDPPRDACPACRGRLVVHQCSKREKPVDYEALARAERERKEREEAERQRIKTEKRKAAEYKRREARRKKKEEEEKRMLEEENRRREQEKRLHQLEAGQFEGANIREDEDEPLPDRPSWSDGTYHQTGVSPIHEPPAIPRFSEIQANMTAQQRKQTYQDEYHRQSFSASTSYSGNHWSSESQGSYHASDSIPTNSSAPANDLDASGLKPSTTLSANDALAALAGLADTLSAAHHADETFDDPLEDGEYPRHHGTEKTSYDYTGSSERRSAILFEYKLQEARLFPRQGAIRPEVAPQDAYSAPTTLQSQGNDDFVIRHILPGNGTLRNGSSMSSADKSSDSKTPESQTQTSYTHQPSSLPHA